MIFYLITLVLALLLCCVVLALPAMILGGLARRLLRLWRRLRPRHK